MTQRVLRIDEDGLVADDTPVRVLVVDDHRVFAEAMAVALSGQRNLEVVGSAHCADAGLAMAEQLQPDVVVMDVRLGDGDGVAVTAELTGLYPSICVVVLTGFAERGLMQRVADAGASAVLPKDGELGEMVQAIRSARRGRFLVHPALLRLLDGPDDPGVPNALVLGVAEHDTLLLLAAGFDAAAIARELDLPVPAAKLHVKELLAKLGAETHLEAVVVAMRNGLLRDPAYG
jgi:DNA-binding NarL/FixJ family response regulator